MSAVDYARYSNEVYKIRKMVDESPQAFNGKVLPLKPSPADARNYQYPKLLKAVGFGTEPRGPFGYRKNLPPVFNQLKRGSCTAASKVSTIKAFQEINQGDYPASGLSVAYLYSREKGIDGMPNTEGSDPRSGYIILQKEGVCLESTMPYSTLSILPAPSVPGVSAVAIAEASKYRINTYAQIASPVDDRSNIITIMRQALAREGPFTIDILVCENFIPDPKTYIVPLPQGLVCGLHEIAVSDDCPDIGCFEGRNTWGPDWGDQGYCYLPYEWFIRGSDTIRWVIEAWTSTDIIVPRAAKEIIVTPGAETMLVDGQEVFLDEPAEIHETGRLMVPLRAIGTNEGYNVGWDGVKAILTKAI